MHATANAPDLTSARYLTPKEIARRYDVDPTTIYRWLATGKLVGLRLAGRRYLIHPDAVAALLQPTNVNPEVARG